MEQMETNQSENRTETKKSAPGILRKPYKIRLLSDGVPAYTGAGTEYLMLGRISDDHQMEVVEECLGKENKLWGRLGSGVGWILLEHAEKLTTETS